MGSFCSRNSSWVASPQRHERVLLLKCALAIAFPRTILRLAENPVTLMGGKLMIQTVINILPKEASLKLKWEIQTQHQARTSVECNYR